MADFMPMAGSLAGFLPETGRADALAKFAKACKLD
jgi:hypothetical protein